MNPSMITDDVGREFLEANGITVEEALELANIDDFPDEGPSSRGRAWTVVQMHLPIHISIFGDISLLQNSNDNDRFSRDDDAAMGLMQWDDQFWATADWTANTLLDTTRPDSPTTFLSYSRARSDNPSHPGTAPPPSPSGLGIAMQLAPTPAPCDVSSVNKNSGSTAGHQPNERAEQATCPSCMHCDIYQHQQPQGQVQLDFPQQHQQHEQPSPSAQQSLEVSGSTQTNVVEGVDSLFLPYPANTASTTSLDDMSLLDGMPPHTFPDDNNNYDDIVPSFDSDLLFTRMDEPLDSFWAPDSHAQRVAEEWAAHAAAHRVPTAPEDSHATSADAADAGTALSSESTLHAASQADDRRPSARRGMSSQQKSTGAAKRRRHEAQHQPSPREQTARQLRHNEMERQRRAAVLEQLQQLAKRLDFVAKQPPRTEVLVATALTIAQRDPQACFNMLRESSPEQLTSMRTQRDGPQLTGEEVLKQKQLTADIVNVIKIAMRAKTRKLPLKYPFTGDGQEQSTFYPGRGWMERFNAELQAIQEYNSTYVTQQVSVDQCHAYCLLQFPAIDPKSLEKKKRNPQQPKSKKKNNVKERERRLYNKFLLVLVQHLCSAQGLSEMDSLSAARARVVAALDRFPTPSPYGDFLEIKRAHTGSKNSEQGAGTA